MPYLFVPSVGDTLCSNKETSFPTKPAKRTKHFLNGTTGVLLLFLCALSGLVGEILRSNKRKHQFPRSSPRAQSIF
jgi:hypothetical protein